MAGSADGAGFINLPKGEATRMPNMPDKPDTWAKLWLALSNPLMAGVIMAITVCLLRVIYDENIARHVIDSLGVVMKPFILI